jgi:hypothetical protein
MKKIALMFLTYGDLSQPMVWNEFLDEKYNIYVHAKFPERIATNSPLKGHLIKNIVPTKWGDVSLVNATLNLLDAAMAKPENYKFVLLSDSCVPLHGARYIHNYLTSNNNSYISSFDSNKERHDSLTDKSFIDKATFKKQHQWIILNRRLAGFALEHRGDLRYFRDMFAPDEHFFVNLFIKHNLPFVNTFTTYTDWSENLSHPRILYRLDCEEIEVIRKKGCLFVRKIASAAHVNTRCLLRDTPLIHQTRWGSLLFLLAVLVIFLNSRIRKSS